MSSGVTFYSSPVRSTKATHEQFRPFCTPPSNAYRGDRLDQYRPFIRSPLRTSRNINVMPNEWNLQDGSQPRLDWDESDKFQQSAAGSENVSFHKHVASHNQPSAVSVYSSPPLPHDRQPTLNQPFASFNVAVPHTTLDTNANDATKSNTFTASAASKFQYEARARNSSSSAQLHAHTTQSRENRKALFLDRLRTKRDATRYEKTGDQIMRIDWVKERKDWEKDMQIRGSRELSMDEVADADLDLDTGADEEMSPTEDKEIEELVGYWEEMQNHIDAQQEIERHSNDGNADVDLSYEDSDEDYDALFMEVMGKEFSISRTNHNIDEGQARHSMNPEPIQFSSNSGTNLEVEMDTS